MHQTPIPALRQRTTLVVVAVLALLLAQAVAQVHALRHLGATPEAPLPGQHATICMDCLAHAPLLVMMGAAAVVFAILARARRAGPPAAAAAMPRRPSRYAFRSRAPPAPR